MRYTFSKLYVVCEWIMNLLLLNLLFIFFSLAGFIVFGVAPAITAMSMVFKALSNKEDIRIIPSFYFIFKKEFLRSNKFGLLYGYAFAIIFMNFLFIRSLPASMHTVAMLVLIVLALITLSSMLYAWPLYIKYQSSVLLLIKNSFVLMIAFLPRTLLTILAISSVLFVSLYQPLLLIFLAFSSMCAIAMLNGQHCLDKIQI